MSRLGGNAGPARQALAPEPVFRTAARSRSYDPLSTARRLIAPAPAFIAAIMPLARIIGGLALLAAVGSTGHAFAQVSDWYETGAGPMRLVIAPPSVGDETVKGIVEIRLEDGWKTYWRDPGSSGIPPQIDISASKGLSRVQLHYPAPVWIDNEYGDFAGYDAPVALPLTLTRSSDGRGSLVADVFLGICEDVCIPVSTRFSMDIDYANGTSLHAARVVQAHAALPGKERDGFALAPSPKASPGDIFVTIDHRLADAKTPPELFVHADDGRHFKPPIVDESVDGMTRFILSPAEPVTQTQRIPVFITVTSGDDSFAADHVLSISPSKP